MITHDKINNKGSALLLVLIVTTTLTLLSFSCWYKSSLFLDLVIQREHFYKNFYATESVLQHGCVVAKKNFDTYIKTPIVINSDSKDGVISLSISLAATNNLLIRAMLKKEDHVLCVLHCNLVKDGQSSENHTKYMVQNFTIGNAV